MTDSLHGNLSVNGGDRSDDGGDESGEDFDNYYCNYVHHNEYKDNKTKTKS